MCPLIFGLSELLEIFLPVAQVISQTLFKGLLVGPLSKAGLRTMCHVHVISYFRLPAKHSVFSILGGLIVFLLCRKNASPSLLLVWNPGACIAIRIQHNPLVGKYFVLGSGNFPIIFSIQGVEEVTPLIIGKVMIFPILVLHLILNGCKETVLSSGAYLLLPELTVADFSIFLVEHVTLLLRWGHLLSKILHITDTPEVLGCDYPKGIDDIIVNIFHFVL